MRKLRIEDLEPRRMLSRSTISTLAINPSPATVGQAVQITDTVQSTAGIPTGNVLFIVDGKALAEVQLRGGVASATDSKLGVGTHRIIALFEPQLVSQWIPSSASGNATVDPSQPTPPVDPPPANTQPVDPPPVDPPPVDPPPVDPPPVDPPPVQPPTQSPPVQTPPTNPVTPATGRSVQVAAVNYDDSQTAAQTSWDAANVQMLIGPDSSYVPTYSAAGDSSWNYLNFYSMYVGSSEWQALATYCAANNLPLESMLLHYSVATTVSLQNQDTGQTITVTLAAGSRVPSYGWYAGTSLTATGARVMMNLFNPQFQKFLAQYAPQQAVGFTGLFIDNASMYGVIEWNNGLNINATNPGGLFQESPQATTLAATITALEAANVQCIAAIHAAGVKATINIGQDTPDPTVLPYVQNVFLEFIDEVPSEDAYWAGLLQSDLATIHAGGANAIVSVTEATTAAQEIDALATFYTYASPGDYFCLQNTNDGNLQTTAWFPALATNIGTPLGPATVVASGTDSLGNPWQVYERRYSGGIVLYRPIASYDENLGSGSAATVNLGGSYQELNADGSLGSLTSSASVGNGQGIVLIE